MTEEMKKAIAYVNENKDWSKAEEEVALERINVIRGSIEDTGTGIGEKIADLMEEYSQDNDLPEGWWEEEMSVDDIFWELDY